MSQERSQSPVKVGIVGSRTWQNKKKVKEMIYSLKQKFGDQLIILSGGCPQGADALAKKYALEFECYYREFNPSHTNKNLYSAMNEGFYNKTYSPKNFFHRNKLLAKSSDYIIAFITEGEKSSGTLHTIKEAHKLNKKIVIVS